MILSLLLIATQAPAADPTIVVTGTPKTDAEIRDEAHAFIRAVAAPAGSADQLGRWNQPICPKVIGATPAEEALVTRKIVEIATEAGIRQTKRKDCAPNLLVAYTDDPSGVTRQVLARRSHSARSLPVAARADLVEGPHPVRWWYDLKVEGRFGTAPTGDNPALLGALNTGANGPGAGAGGQLAQSENQSGNVADYNSSIIGSRSRQSIGAATVVVDVNRVKGQPKDSVAAFVAMVALAPLKLPPKPVPMPTITNLFYAAEAARAVDLSDWDRAYVAALYKTAANRAAKVQSASMTARIAKSMRGDD